MLQDRLPDVRADTLFSSQDLLGNIHRYDHGQLAVDGSLESGALVSMRLAKALHTHFTVVTRAGGSMNDNVAVPVILRLAERGL